MTRMPYMTRTDVLQDLAGNGRDYRSERLHELAVELDLLVSDVFVFAFVFVVVVVVVVAGRTPPHMVPPTRDPKVLRDFTYRVTYCEHASLAPLEEFVSALALAAPAPAAAQLVEFGPAKACGTGALRPHHSCGRGSFGAAGSRRGRPESSMSRRLR